MKPLISVQLTDSRRTFFPGDELACQYQIDAIEPHEILAVEASVLWRTEGKGEEDMAVHFFRRRTPLDAPESDLRMLDEFRTVLPHSPLSYEGAILKLHWCVRIRVFGRSGRDAHAELRFRLGEVPPAERVEAPTAARREPGSPRRTRDAGEDGF